MRGLSCAGNSQRPPTITLLLRMLAGSLATRLMSKLVIGLAMVMVLLATATPTHAAIEQPSLSAAHHWDSDRIVATAERYEQGRGLPRSPLKAYAFFCLGAGRGHPEAAYALGWIYLNGRGVAANPGAAASWLNYAAKHGIKHARRLLKRRLSKVQATPDNACPLPGKRQASRKQARQWVRALAPQYDLDSRLVEALVAAESSFNIHARSPKNAHGLMQLIPATAKRFGVRQINDPVENIRGGMAYLRWLLDQFNGNVKLALAGYNAGENAVRRHRGIPPYRETQGYVKRITAALEKPSSAPVARQTSQPNKRLNDRLARMLLTPGR